MTVRLETTIRRYIGLSTDVKPDGVDAGGISRVNLLPAGSSFLETDTARIYRWDGQHWTYAIDGDESASLLAEILAALVHLCELQEATVASL